VRLRALNILLKIFQKILRGVPMKITELHLAVLMFIGISLALIGLWAIHWGLPLVLVGVACFAMSMEIEPTDGGKK
jgi:hypothetical protein